MRDRIQGYFRKVWGSNIEVTKVDYDENDAETTDDALVVKSIYNVKVLKRIS